jgi:hypothetical protein
VVQEFHDSDFAKEFFCGGFVEFGFVDDLDGDLQRKKRKNKYNTIKKGGAWRDGWVSENTLKG